jgi:hypothetical protein
MPETQVERSPEPGRQQCDCRKVDGMIYHQRATCTDPVAARLGWYADGDASGSYMSPGEAAELVEEWVGRLDRFCAALEQQGFRVERNGLSVRIDPPADSRRQSKGPHYG